MRFQNLRFFAGCVFHWAGAVLTQEYYLRKYILEHRHPQKYYIQKRLAETSCQSTVAIPYRWSRSHAVALMQQSSFHNVFQ